MQKRTAWILYIILSFLPFTGAQAQLDAIEDRILISLTGGAFKLSPENRAYAILQPNNANPPSGQVLSLDPRFTFGGGVDVAYGFADSRYDIHLNYFGVHNHTVRAPISGIIAPILAPPTWVVTTATGVSTDRITRFNSASVNFGIAFAPDAFSIHPQIGIEYLNIVDNHSTIYNNILGPTPFSGQINQNSQFTGLGPSFATELRYNVKGGLSLMTFFLYSAVVGPVKGEYSGDILSNSTNTPFNLQIKTRQNLISHLKTELALVYTFACENWLSNIMIGYRFDKLFGGVEKMELQNATSKLLNSKINLNLQGPFIRWNMGFNVKKCATAVTTDAGTTASDTCATDSDTCATDSGNSADPGT